MRSDIIHVTSEGAGVEEALSQAERVAAYKGLPGKNAMQLRLLAEEMMGLMQAMAGKHDADFWIDDDKNTYKLHLSMPVIMNADMRQRLLALSSSGKNAAAKGVMGKIRSLMERMTEPASSDMTVDYAAGLYLPAGASSSQMGSLWSFNRYKASLGEKAETEEWDELEKSVVGKLADEVEIAIADNTAELIIYKAF